MVQRNFHNLFSPKFLNELLPPERSDEFFAALYGDPDEGAYDISLVYTDFDPGKNALFFELQLRQRPDKCLACNLTYGLPEVFSCHPLINITGIVKRIESALAGEAHCVKWELGHTLTPENDLHTIPLTLFLG